MVSKKIEIEDEEMEEESEEEDSDDEEEEVEEDEEEDLEEEPSGKGCRWWVSILIALICGAIGFVLGKFVI